MPQASNAGVMLALGCVLRCLEVDFSNRARECPDVARMRGCIVVARGPGMDMASRGWRGRTWVGRGFLGLEVRSRGRDSASLVLLRSA
eukprot:1954516-Alexandrium_andersonii.AAC.1